jgi:transposase
MRFDVTEHRILRAQCRCGAQQCSNFPKDIVGAVQYGARVRAAAVYLTQYQQIPFKRCADALRDLFGIKISAGSVVNYVQQAGQALLPAVAQIAQTLLAQEVVHFDETGLRQGKTLVWMHSASTADLTWYGAHQKRGKEAMTALNILPRFKGIAVHDGLQAYREYDCLHALCNAHHLRELVYVFETSGQQWARDMMHLLCAAKDAMQAVRVAGTVPGEVWMRDIDEQYHALLRRGVTYNPEQLRPLDQPARRGRVKQSVATNLLRRLYDYAEDVLHFTTDPNVPFDNNQAERDIRMPKLKQKVSGGFRSAEGITDFCTIRSYLSTLRKNQQDLFDALREAFNGRAPAAV